MATGQFLGGLDWNRHTHQDLKLEIVERTPAPPGAGERILRVT
jgi:hypothetical protein